MQYDIAFSHMIISFFPLLSGEIIYIWDIKWKIDSQEDVGWNGPLEVIWFDHPPLKQGHLETVA